MESSIRAPSLPLHLPQELRPRGGPQCIRPTLFESSHQDLSHCRLVSCSLQNCLLPPPLFSCQRNTTVLGRILVVPFFKILSSKKDMSLHAWFQIWISIESITNNSCIEAMSLILLLFFPLGAPRWCPVWLSFRLVKWDHQVQGTIWSLQSASWLGWVFLRAYRWWFLWTLEVLRNMIHFWPWIWEESGVKKLDISRHAVVGFSEIPLYI